MVHDYNVMFPSINCRRSYDAYRNRYIHAIYESSTRASTFQWPPHGIQILCYWT